MPALSRQEFSIKLPADFKAAWLAFLRDPANKQAEGVLKSKTGFCCLGGAVQVHNGPNCWTYENGSWYSPGENEYMPFAPDLPQEIMAVLDQALPSPPASWDNRTASMTVMAFLSDANDGARGLPHHTFAEIADWIEECL